MFICYDCPYCNYLQFIRETNWPAKRYRIVANISACDCSLLLICINHDRSCYGRWL